MFARNFFKFSSEGQFLILWLLRTKWRVASIWKPRSWWLRNGNVCKCPTWSIDDSSQYQSSTVLWFFPYSFKQQPFSLDNVGPHQVTCQNVPSQRLHGICRINRGDCSEYCAIELLQRRSIWPELASMPIQQLPTYWRFRLSIDKLVSAMRPKKWRLFQISQLLSLFTFLIF